MHLFLQKQTLFRSNFYHCRAKRLKGGSDADEHIRPTPIVSKEISSASLEASGAKRSAQADKDTVSEITGKAESPAPVTADQLLDDETDPTFTYNMQHKRRGVFIIINNTIFKFGEKRIGADIDAVKLEQIFRNLGFQVRRHDNQTREDMLRIFQQGQ